MGEYTKGDWKVERPLQREDGLYDDNLTAIKAGDNIICQLPEPHYIPDTGDRLWYNGQVEVLKANAHLIAAAPQMYEALKEAMDFIKGTYREFISDMDWERELLPQIEQALAKAEGKEVQ